jgi:4-hydroxy-tetrahydrodipicolinate synthase
MRIHKSEAKEWARESMSGPWGVHWLPYDDDFQIDEPALRDHVDKVVAQKMTGVAVAGLLCEIWNLSLEERKRVASVTIDQINGRIPAYVSGTSHSVEDTLDIVHNAEDIGAEAVMIWAPYEHAKSEAEVYRFYEHIHKNSDIAIAAYSTPHAGAAMSPELVHAVSQLEGVCSIKYVTWDFSHYVRATELCGKDIVISYPFEESILVQMQYFGAQLLLATTSVNLMQSENYQPILEEMTLASEGRFEEAQQVYASMASLRKMWTDFYDVYPSENRHPNAETKYWAHALGLLENYKIRPPQPQISEAAKARIDESLKQFPQLLPQKVAVG